MVNKEELHEEKLRKLLQKELYDRKYKDVFGTYHFANANKLIDEIIESSRVTDAELAEAQAKEEAIAKEEI